MDSILPNALFVILALSGAVIASLAALRARQPTLFALNLGAVVALGQFGLLATLAACGAPPVAAQGVALGFGVAASWRPVA